jgi:hypothetical protein
VGDCGSPMRLRVYSHVPREHAIGAGDIFARAVEETPDPLLHFAAAPSSTRVCAETQDMPDLGWS